MSEEDLKAAKDAEKKAKEWVAPEWAGGVVQQRQAEARRAEMAAQAAQPFAKTRCMLPSIFVPHFPAAECSEDIHVAVLRHLVQQVVALAATGR